MLRNDRVRQSKLRWPEKADHVLRRPRLLAAIDDRSRPITLLVAPAGFGKTTVAAAWASQDATAWLTADASDTSLERFWAHLHTALDRVAPGLGYLVEASLQIPYRASAAELGRILADELADHGEPVRIVIDDVHLIPAGETHEFLIGLLDVVPSALRLLLTARIAPPLALNQLRLRGQITEIGSEDLLFNEREVRAFLSQAGTDSAPEITVEAAAQVRRRTGGWAAGLRLVSLREGEDLLAPGRVSEAPALDFHLLDPLLEETMASFEPHARQMLLRAALPERFSAPLVQAIGGSSGSNRTAQQLLGFVRSSGIARRSPQLGGEWFEFHPLFRTLLLRRLEYSESPENLATLHSRAAGWFEINAMVDAAVVHHLAAGDIAAAAAIIKHQVQPALAREDWPSVARWLALLPRDLVEADTRLLLARGWVLHFRGLSRQLADVLERLETRRGASDMPTGDAESLRAETALMQFGSLVCFQIDAEGSLAAGRELASQLTPGQVFAAGVAQAGIGIALHVTGRTRDAVAYLERALERAPTPLDAAGARLIIGLLWIHGQASHAGEVAAVAQAMLDLAERNDLRLSAGWARRFLGDASYEQDDLDGALAHYTAIVQDHAFFHLAGVREALFGLALAYVAQGRVDEAWRSLQRAREIMVGADALEHLALLEAYTAYLALTTGDHHRALAWARNHAPEIDGAPLFMGLHPTVLRATIFLVAGDEAEMRAAVADLDEIRARAAHGNYGATLARVNALLSVAAMKQGKAAHAVAMMRASLEGGVARGFRRTYLDLLPLFRSQMQALTEQLVFPSAIQAAVIEERGEQSRAPANGAGGLLTEREREVLAALFLRLSYKEIAENLYISPATVKRHASSIYSKMGVSGRTEAIRAARGLGWQA